jgi:hypothetical protein
VVCKAAPLAFQVSSGASSVPRHQMPGAALTQGTNPQALPTPGGFALAFQPERAMFVVGYFPPNTPPAAGLGPGTLKN